MRLALLVLLVLVGCGDRTPPATPSRTTETPPVTPTSAAPAEEAPAPPDIAEARVRTLLDSWLAAQNSGSFPAYSALYAPRFQGVRRTGETTRRFDRESWLADRQRMFARPMHVAISDVEVTSTPRSASVRFVQRFSSGTFSDEGPKRMLVVVAGDALLISSEEMLASRTLAGAEANIASGLYPTLDLHEGALVILGPATDAQASGTPRLLRARETETRVAVRAATRGVPQTATALVGQPIRLVSGATTCETTISALGVAAVVVPHFGMVQQWQGISESGEPGLPRATPAQIAAQVYEIAHERWLVGIATSRCGETFAAVPVAATPVLFARADASAATVAEVLRKIGAGAQGTALRTTMREGMQEASEDGTAPDDAAVNAAIAANLTVVEHTHDTRAVIVAKVAIPGPCGGHVETFVFERVGQALTPRALGVEGLDVVFDVTGDGTPEAASRSDFGARRGLFRLGDGGGRLNEWSLTFLDCPC